VHRSFSIVNGRPLFRPFDAYNAYDVKTGRMIAPSEPTFFSSEGILRNGDWLLLSSRGQVAAVLFPDRVEVRDAVTGQLLRQFATSFSGLSGLAALSAGGSRLALARGTKEEITVEVWNIETGERLWSETVERPLADRDMLIRRSAETSMSLESFKVPTLRFSPDSQTLIGWHSWGDYDAALRVWDVAIGRGRTVVRRERGREMQLRDVAFTSDGSVLAISRSSELRSFDDTSRSRPREKPTGTVTLARTSTLEILAEFAQQPDAFEVAVAPDASLVATGDANGDVRIWRVPR
jgi:WD40 repeat protein